METLARCGDDGLLVDPQHCVAAMAAALPMLLAIATAALCQTRAE